MEEPNKHRQDADRERRGLSGSVYQFVLSRKSANMQFVTRHRVSEWSGATRSLLWKGDDYRSCVVMRRLVWGTEMETSPAIMKTGMDFHF